MSSEAVAEEVKDAPAPAVGAGDGSSGDAAVAESGKKAGKRGHRAITVLPDSFVPEQHFYPRVLNATIHPIVATLFDMNVDRIVKRYCHLHPDVKPEALQSVLRYQPRHFRWAGCDLFHVTASTGNRHMVRVCAPVALLRGDDGAAAHAPLAAACVGGAARRLVRPVNRRQRTSCRSCRPSLGRRAAPRARRAPCGRCTEVTRRLTGRQASRAARLAAGGRARSLATDDGSSMLVVLSRRKRRCASLRPREPARCAVAPRAQVPTLLTGAADAVPPARARTQVVVETNSCPSGQKSMPLLQDNEEMGGYKTLLDQVFAPLLLERCEVEGALAVIYDKNRMEASGYAAALAEVAREPVYMAEFYAEDPEPKVRFVEGVMQVMLPDGAWQPIRAAFRYVTQKPWTRIPVVTRTRVLNPILPCLAGGRNKLVASKAYELYNAELMMEQSGLAIQMPDTRHDVSKAEVPLLVKLYGGYAVVKVP